MKSFIRIFGYLTIATILGVALLNNISTYSYLYGIIVGILGAIIVIK